VLPDWYEENIEEPIRDVVRLLRDNGFNTQCSCGHEMYVQCEYTIDYEIKRLYDLLRCWLYAKGIPVDFTIDVRIDVRDGHPYPSLEVRFGGKCDFAKLEQIGG